MAEKKKLSRREFLGAVGITAAGAGFLSVGGWKLAKALGLQPEKFTEKLGNQLDWYWKEIKSYIDNGGPQAILGAEKSPIQIVKAQNTSTPQLENTSTLQPDTPTETPEAVEEIVPIEKEEENGFDFAGINFSDPANPIGMMITTTEDNKIIIPEFYSYSWSPEVDEKNVFDPDNNTGIAWKDSGERIGLWVHSGRAGLLHEGYTMWNTQKFIEEDEKGNARPAWAVNEILDKIIRGSDITIKQGNKIITAKITAAVRMPPDRVIYSTVHVLDMVPYIAKTYPGKGFEELVDKKQVLLPKFCGRKAADEKGNKNLPYYQQARFVFGIEMT